MRRKKIILFALLGVFALSLGYRIMNPYRQEKVAQLTYTRDKAGKAKRARGPSPPVSEEKKAGEAVGGVLLALFQEPPRHSEKVNKNIFYDVEKTTQETRVTMPIEKEAQKPPVASPAEDPREKVNQELGRFRVFGSYRSGNDKVLFLERGNDILVVREGDRINGKYLVKRIEEESLVLRAEQINEDVHIDLSEF